MKKLMTVVVSALCAAVAFEVKAETDITAAMRNLQTPLVSYHSVSGQQNGDSRSAALDMVNLVDGNINTIGYFRYDPTKLVADELDDYFCYSVKPTTFPGKSVTVSRYTITGAQGYATKHYPLRWTLQASNDNATWHILDTRELVTADWTQNETKSFDVPQENRGDYRYYRINITAYGGGAMGYWPHCDMGEIVFYGAIGSGEECLAVGSDVDGDAGEELGITVAVAVPEDPSLVTVRYSTDGGASYSTVRPTFSDPGTYSVKWQVSADGYATQEGENTVRLTPVSEKPRDFTTELRDAKTAGEFAEEWYAVSGTWIPSYGIANVFDGNADTIWALPSENTWFTIHFPEGHYAGYPVVVTNFYVYSGSAHSVYIQGSEDGTNWTTIVTKSIASGMEYGIEIERPVSYRHYRYYSYAGWPYVREFRMYGYYGYPDNLIAIQTSSRGTDFGTGYGTTVRPASGEITINAPADVEVGVLRYNVIGCVIRTSTDRGVTWSEPIVSDRTSVTLAADAPLTSIEWTWTDHPTSLERDFYISKSGDNSDGLSWATAYTSPARLATELSSGGSVWFDADTWDLEDALVLPEGVHSVSFRVKDGGRAVLRAAEGSRLMTLAEVEDISFSGLAFADAKVSISAAADSGAALTLGIVNGGTVSFSNCTFSGNAVVGKMESMGSFGGAAICAIGSGTLDFRVCTFADNAVTTSNGRSLSYPVGAALMTSGVRIQATDCVFRNNRSIGNWNMYGPNSSMGAVIYSVGSSAGGGIDIEDCLFTGNGSMTDDPCVSMALIRTTGSDISSRPYECTVRNSTFAGNAALFPIHSHQGIWTVEKCVVDGFLYGSSGWQGSVTYKDNVANQIAVNDTPFAEIAYSKDWVLISPSDCVGYGYHGMRTPVERGVLNVSADGDDATGDGSADAPFRTLTRALVFAENGDTVRLGAGTYDAAAGEVFPIDLGNRENLRIEGAGSDAVTVSAAGAAAPVLLITNACAVTVSGLTLTGARLTAGACGAAVHASLAPRTELVDVTIAGNAADVETGSAGGVVYFLMSPGSGLRNCRIRGNSVRSVAGAAYGAAIRTGCSTVYCLNTEIRDNTAAASDIYGIGLYFGALGVSAGLGNGAVFRNCLIAGNVIDPGHAGEVTGVACGGAFFCGDSGANKNSILKVDNCTVSDNGISLLWHRTTTCVFRNVIIGENGAGVKTYNDQDETALEYVNFIDAIIPSTESNYSTSGSVRVQKGDAGLLSGYRIQSASPAVDAGRTLGWMDAAAVDLAGRPRVIAHKKRREPLPDLGCFECGKKGFLLMVR